MRLSEAELKLCGKVLSFIHKQFIEYIQKNDKKFKPEVISKLRGTDEGENSWANQLADIYLSQSYKVLSQKKVENPPMAIMDYFSSKDGDQKFWRHNPLSYEILMCIMCRNMDNAKIIYNYKNKIHSEHSHEQLKKMLFARNILGKKEKGSEGK